MTTISVRISDKLKKVLEIIAKETERSKSFHVQKAIKFYLKEQADFQIALDRLNDSSDSIISISEMRKKLEL
jgi:predicted DNA-binding protein